MRYGGYQPEESTLSKSCRGYPAGIIEPIYVETKVTVYPYLVSVNYENNRVTKAGKSSISLSIN